MKTGDNQLVRAGAETAERWNGRNAIVRGEIDKRTDHDGSIVYSKIKGT